MQRIEFQSLTDFAQRWQAAGKPADHTMRNPGWAGVAVEAAPDLLKDGWLDARVMAMAASAADTLAADSQLVDAPVWENEPAQAGCFMNVPALLADDPFYMVMPEMILVPRDNPVVTVVLSGAVSASVDTKELERRGIYALTLVRALQARGYSIDLWYEWRTRRNASIKIHIMRPGDVLSDAHLLLVVVHKAFQRFFPFAAGNMMKGMEGGGYHGTPESPPAREYPDGAIITQTIPSASGTGIADAVKNDLVKAGIITLD